MESTTLPLLRSLPLGSGLKVVSGSPLPPAAPGEEFMMRSAAFELLTGLPDPRLEERDPSVPEAFSPHAAIV